MSVSAHRLACSLGLCAGLAMAQPATAYSTLDLVFNYRLTPAAGSLGNTIATAHFEEIVDPYGRAGIDLVLTNVASNTLPGLGATSYISGLLTAFDYEDLDLPSITIEQFANDSAQSDRWEPQEDVATVDHFTFTSELGFPRSETPSTAGWRLGVGESAHVQFWNADGQLPSALTLDKLINASRGAAVDGSIPDIMAAIKVRSIPNLTGGENIESVPTLVIGAQTAPIAAVPIPAALPMFLSALAGVGLFRQRTKA